MNKVFVFGDCHTARVWEHFDPSQSSIDLRMWGKGGTKVYGIKFDEFLQEDRESSGMESTPQNLSFNPKVKFSEYQSADLVVLWLGYIDIRQFLPKYKNADEIAKIYINEIKSFFKNKDVVLIEPLPQFTEMLLKYEDISPSYEYEDRQHQNKLFLKKIKKYARKNKIKIIVTQKEMLKSFNKKQLTTDMTHNKAPHPVDGLQDEYNKKLYDLFYKAICKYLLKNN